MKKAYIEYLRFIATLAVIMIHITMTEVVNSSITQMGWLDYAIYSAGYALTRWAVPVFIMITGSLLLNPEKEFTTLKQRHYILRMVLVLFIFGSVFSAMEIIFTDGLSEWYLLIPKCLLRVIQNRSWDHLWYIYLLIGLYLLTPFTRASIVNLSRSQLLTLILVLYGINYIRPAINIIFDINISDLWIAANGYYAYYLMGYYLSLEDNKVVANRREIYIAAVMSMLFMIACDTLQIIHTGTYSRWIRDANPLVPIIAVAIFVFAKTNIRTTHKASAICKSITQCSFGIYLIHPLFINLLYKVVGITPRDFPIAVGIFAFFITVLLLSWSATIILRKIPFIRDLL